MGKKADEEVERVKAVAAGHHERIRAAGSALDYCMDYIRHIASLKEPGGEHVVIRDRASAYPRMAVQIAATAAVAGTRKLELELDQEEEVEKWARASWVHSAGHFSDSGSEGDPEVVVHPNPRSMEMIRKGADTRKAKAAEQWDRLIRSDVESLGTLALFGREAGKPVTRKEKWVAYAIVAGLAVAVAAYGASNWFLSTKITAPYTTDEGIQQRRDATDRVLAHDGLMSSTARRSGIFQLVLDWPLSPTTAETAAFTELATDILQIHRAMAERNMICGKTEISSDEAMDVISEVNDAIDFQDVSQEDLTRAESLVIKAISRVYPLPCGQ